MKKYLPKNILHFRSDRFYSQIPLASFYSEKFFHDFIIKKIRKISFQSLLPHNMFRRIHMFTYPKEPLVEILRNEFKSFFELDYILFIQEIQRIIPESLYLKGKANVSAEGILEGKPPKNVYGLTEDEEIRAFSGLLRFKDIINGAESDYKHFVACQIEMKKPVLSYESFKNIKDYVMQTLSTPEDYAAAMWSILCNDLGKVHSIVEIHQQLPNKKNNSHDLLLTELLQENPTLFPGFMNLTSEHRQQIIAGYASGCDISQFEQLELPPVALEALRKLDKKSLDLYILHTIFDVSGAAAHFKSNGSLTLHEETWTFFNAAREALEKLHHPKNNSIEEVYQYYLAFRGRCVGIENTSEEATALIRIAGFARLAALEQGKMLLTVWKNLPEHTKDVLTKELNIHGGKETQAIFINYGVAMLLNPQSALQKELNDLAKSLNLQVSEEQKAIATMEGLRIGLINLGQAFENARALIGHSQKNQVFFAECSEIAKFLSKEPRKSLEMDFQFESLNDNLANFKLINRPSKQKELNEKKTTLSQEMVNRQEISSSTTENQITAKKGF